MRKGIKEKDIRDFEKCVKKLNDILERIHEYNPKVALFISGECVTSFNLIGLGGIPEEGLFSERQKGVVSSVEVNYSDCGGW